MMSWTTTLEEVLKKHNQAAARGGKAVGFGGQKILKNTTLDHFSNKN